MKTDGKSPKDSSFFKVSHAVVESENFKKLGLSSKILFMTMCRLRNRLSNGRNKTPEGWFWRNNKLLCSDSGMSHGSMVAARRELVDAGLLIRDITRTPPRYRIIDDIHKDSCKRKKLGRDATAYEVYLRTQAWLDRRESRIAFAGQQCELCGSKKQPLHVHHKTYIRRGYEPLRDLICLCKKCHEFLHDKVPS